MSDQVNNELPENDDSKPEVRLEDYIASLSRIPRHVEGFTLMHKGKDGSVRFLALPPMESLDYGDTDENPEA